MTRKDLATEIGKSKDRSLGIGSDTPEQVRYKGGPIAFAGSGCMGSSYFPYSRARTFKPIGLTEVEYYARLKGGND